VCIAPKKGVAKRLVNDLLYSTMNIQMPTIAEIHAAFSKGEAAIVDFNWKNKVRSWQVLAFMYDLANLRS